MCKWEFQEFWAQNFFKSLSQNRTPLKVPGSSQSLCGASSFRSPSKVWQMLSLLWLMLHVFGSPTSAPHNALVASLPFGHPFLSNSASYVQKWLGQTDWDLSRSHFVTMDSEKISWNFTRLHYLQNTTVSFLFIDPSDITFVITIIIWVLLDNLFFLHYNPSISKAISFSINLGNVSSTTPFARSWRIFSTLLTCSGSSSASSIKCICPTTLSKGRAGPGRGLFCWPWPWPSGSGHLQLGPGPRLAWPRARRVGPGPGQGRPWPFDI